MLIVTCIIGSHLADAHCSKHLLQLHHLAGEGTLWGTVRYTQEEAEAQCEEGGQAVGHHVD